MSYWQYEYLREDVTMTRNTTYRIDLLEQGLLSAIQIRMSASSVSDAFATTHNWRICDFISKIEVIGNGSTVIKSLSGQELQALQFFDTGIASLDYWLSYGACTQRFNVMLLFGRYLFDTIFGLDLARWNNVELRITNTATSTYFGQDISVSLLCYYLRDFSGSFRGYMRTEEWKTWTTAQNTWEYLELPTENTIRRVIMQLIPARSAANIESTGMSNLADDIEVSLKTGLIRVYRGGIDDLMRMNVIMLKRLVMTYPQFYMTNDYGRNVGIGYVLGNAVSGGAMNAAVTNVKPNIEVGNTAGHQKQTAYGGDSSFQGLFVGQCPENCLLLPFNIPDEPEFYLDPEMQKTVKLDIHTRDSSSAASGTINVVLDRLVY